MTGGDITELRYWLDLLIKAIIGIVVSVVGLDYRSMRNSLEELQQSKYSLTVQVQVMQSEVAAIKDRLERIEEKLDRALSR